MHSPDRKTRRASLRFSQELDELLQWEGLSAIERLAINGFEDDHFSDTSEHSVAVRRSFEDEHDAFLPDEASNDFSELSTMLESAKKKLEVSNKNFQVPDLLRMLNDLSQLLEGNLKGARNSLFVPSLPSPASTESFQSTRPSTAHTASWSISSNDNDDDPYFEAVHARRITSAPLKHLQLQRLPFEHAGHARYNSDSKIGKISIHPVNLTGSGSPLRSPRSPRRQLHKTSMDLLREKAKVLGPVTEDEVRDTWNQPSHTRQASSQASIASMQILRTQAAGVRRSLQKIKRQSLDLSTLEDSLRLHDEVTALERTLSRREEDILHLEQVVPATLETLTGSKNSLQTDEQKEYFYNDDFRQEEYDVQVEMHRGTRIHDEESDMEGGYDEYNTDAFDYEMFILNSALGNYEGRFEPSEERPKPSKQEKSPYQSPNMRTSREYSSRSSYDSDRLVRESLATMWPKPRIARNVEPMSPVDSISSVEAVPSRSVATSNHQQNDEKEDTVSTLYSRMSTGQSMLDLGKDQDATSVILSALLPASPNKANSPALDKKDQLLLFSFATALRDTCAAFGKNGDEKSRQRLLAATKLLRGEAA